MCGQSAEELLQLQDEEMRDSSEKSKSAEESSFEFQQFYVVANHSPLDDDSENSIYKIDVSTCANSTSIESLEPIISLYEDDICRSAFAVLGHTLYIFGGMDVVSDREKFPFPYWRSEMRTLDMKAAAASCPSTKICLVTSTLPRGKNHMSGRKYKPQAVVIDDTRICVFSLMLFDEMAIDDDIVPSHTLPNFELFDTITETWTQLPEPMQYKYGRFLIGSFYISHSTLTISTTHGFYRMKFNVPNPSWEKMSDEAPSIISPYFPSPGIFIDEKEKSNALVISPFELVQWKKFGKPYSIQHKAEREGLRTTLVSFGSDGGLCLKDDHIFIVRIGYEEEIWRNISSLPFLLVDIYKNDSELASKLSEGKEIEAVKSFTFSLNSLRRHLISIYACFPVKKLKQTQNVETLQNKRFRPDNLTVAWYEDRDGLV